MTLPRLNGTQLSQAALKVDERGAFELLLTSMLRTDVSAEIFDHEPPVAVQESATGTTISAYVSRPKAPVAMWSYTDPIQLSYNRLRVQDLAARYGTVLHVDFPSTLRKAFKQYLERNQLYDRSAFIDDLELTGPRNAMVNVSGNSVILIGSRQFSVRQAPKQLGAVIKSRELKVFNPEVHVSTNALADLVAVLNEQNATNLPRPINVNEVKTGIPVKLNDYNEVNTEVLLQGHNSEVFLGEVKLTYHRIDFAWQFGGRQFVVTGPVNPDIPYLVEQIRLQTGFPIDMGDIVDDNAFRVAEGDTETLTLFFAESSIRYTGEITIDYTAE